MVCLNGFNSPVQMNFNGNALNIDVYVDFTGVVNTTFSDGTTYKDAAIKGIENWNNGGQPINNVFGENVTINVDVHEGENEYYINPYISNSYAVNNWGQNYFEVNINHEPGVSNTAQSFLSPWRSEDPGTLTMYDGDERNSSNYSRSDFEATVTHEMGHIFGLDDAYPDRSKLNWLDKILGVDLRPDAEAIVGEYDVMRYQFNGINISNKDIEMMILAYYDDKFQYYFDYFWFNKSAAMSYIFFKTMMINDENTLQCTEQ